MIKSIKKSQRFKPIAITLFVLVIISLLAWFMFARHIIDYEDLQNEIRVDDSGKHTVYNYHFGLGGGEVLRESSTPVVLDYDHGISYCYNFVRYNASRSNIWFDDESYYPALSVTEEGFDPHGRSSAEYVPETHSRDEYIENPALMETRFLRIYYVNSDNSCVLIWEHPNTAEIEADSEDEINSDPLFYVREKNSFFK